MIIRSILTQENPFNSTAEIKEWIVQRNREVVVDVKRIPFSEMKSWHSNADGSISHDSGRFFSIVGIDVHTDYGDVSHWRQPIILQPEVGYLGILTKEINGVLYCLMQAKIEPGNVNCVQISPTLQATKSNYSRVHAGKSPNYLEYFVNAKPENIILDQLQSEQGARFLRKRNRNIIIKVDEDYDSKYETMLMLEDWWKEEKHKYRTVALPYTNPGENTTVKIDRYTFQLVYPKDKLTYTIDTDRMKRETIQVVNGETGEVMDVNAYDYFCTKPILPKEPYVKVKVEE